MNSEIVAFVENNDRTKGISFDVQTLKSRLPNMVYTPFQYWIVKNKTLPPSCLEYTGCYTRQFYVPELGYTSIQELAMCRSPELENKLYIKLTKDLERKIWNDSCLTRAVFRVYSVSTLSQ